MNDTGTPSNKKRIIVIAVIGLLVVVGITRVIAGRRSTPASKNTTVSANGDQTGGNKQEINKEISIPVSTKTDSPHIQYTLESAEVLDEIVVRGQLAKAAKGRKFFVVNVKVKNDSTQGFSINTRDFVRLEQQGKEGEWIAPEIHNDPVEVQAISTKYTRMGFPVDAGTTTFKLQLGEINGEKSIVDVTFE